MEIIRYDTVRDKNTRLVFYLCVALLAIFNIYASIKTGHIGIVILSIISIFMFLSVGFYGRMGITECFITFDNESCVISKKIVGKVYTISFRWCDCLNMKTLLYRGARRFLFQMDSPNIVYFPRKGLCHKLFFPHTNGKNRIEILAPWNSHDCILAINFLQKKMPVKDSALLKYK